MTRYAVIAAVILMGLLVLYLPTRHGAGEYRALLMLEQDRATGFWGEQVAERIVERAHNLDKRAEAKANTVMPPGPVVGQKPEQLVMAKAGVNLAGAVLHNQYTSAFGAQFQLAFYRACAVLQVLPLVGAFLAAVVVDGAMLRLLKSLRFQQHNAEVFGLCVLLATLALCGGVVLLVWPQPLPPALLPSLLLMLPWLVWWALANYHRRAYPTAS